MARWSKLWIVFFVAFLLGLALGTHIVHNRTVSAAAHSYVIDRDAVAYGRTYAEWSAAWEQWANSISVSKHPLFDNGDCSTGQSGPVWFLGGKQCPNGETCSYTNVVRTCNVPADKALYFPILNDEDSVLEERLAENPGDPSFQQVAAMRAEAEKYVTSAVVSASLDDVAIPQVQQRFRVQSTAFSFTLPKDNQFTSFYGKPFPEGSYFPAVDDGWFVMLAPLPPGRHVLQLQGAVRGSTMKVKYNLNVGQ